MAPSATPGSRSGLSHIIPSPGWRPKGLVAARGQAGSARSLAPASRRGLGAGAESTEAQAGDLHRPGDDRGFGVVPRPQPRLAFDGQNDDILDRPTHRNQHPGRRYSCRGGRCRWRTWQRAARDLLVVGSHHGGGGLSDIRRRSSAARLGRDDDDTGLGRCPAPQPGPRSPQPGSQARPLHGGSHGVVRPRGAAGGLQDPRRKLLRGVRPRRQTPAPSAASPWVGRLAAFHPA